MSDDASDGGSSSSFFPSLSGLGLGAPSGDGDVEGQGEHKAEFLGAGLGILRLDLDEVR